MKRLLVVLGLLALTSCGGNIAPIAAGLTVSAVSPETVARLASLCRAAGPSLNIARSMGALPPGAAQAILAEVGPYCAIMAAGQTPATTDANTLHWLTQNLEGPRSSLVK